MTDGRDDPVADEVAAASGRRTVPAGAFVAAVVVAAVLGLVAVASLSFGGGGDDGDREVRLAAGRFTERFLTFEHDALDEWRADVLSLSTGGFAEEVEDVESGLERLLAEDEIDATTEVTDVFVGQEERGTIGVVVVYDRDLVGADFSRSESERYLQLALVRVDGAWLVDDVIDIATTEALAGS